LQWALNKSLKGSLRGAPLVFSIEIFISIEIIEKASQVLRAMATQQSGLMALSVVLSLGFTQGAVGFGIDAFAMEGLKLDSGDGRSGARSSVDVLPHNSKGQPEDSYSKVGGAARSVSWIQSSR